MEKRIALVRKEKQLSVRAFGEAIGISGSAVSKLESGENGPSEQSIRAICSEFNVSREWLETGEGEMRLKESAEDAERMVNLMRGMSENKKKLFRILVDMPDELLDEMISYMKKEIR